MSFTQKQLDDMVTETLGDLDTLDNFARKFLSPLQYHGSFMFCDEDVNVTSKSLSQTIDEFAGIGLENSFLGASLQAGLPTKSDSKGIDINKIGDIFSKQHLTEAVTLLIEEKGSADRLYQVIVGHAVFETMVDNDEWKDLMANVSQKNLQEQGFIGCVEHDDRIYTLYTDACIPQEHKFIYGYVVVGPMSSWGSYMRELNVTVKEVEDCYDLYRVNWIGNYFNMINEVLAKITYMIPDTFDGNVARGAHLWTQDLK